MNQVRIQRRPTSKLMQLKHAESALNAWLDGRIDAAQFSNWILR